MRAKEKEICQVAAMKVILKRVKRLLMRGEYRYICHAINDVERGIFGSCHKAECNRLRAWIRGQLEPKRTLASWVHHHYQTHQNTDKEDSARLAWIDHMIGVLDEMMRELL